MIHEGKEQRRRSLWPTVVSVGGGWMAADGTKRGELLAG